MKFKSFRLLQQYKLLPVKLIEICDAFEVISRDNGVVPVVTRVADPVTGESGVHLDYRAIDFRDEYFDGKVKRKNYTLEVVEEILEVINHQFQRSDRYPTIMHHSFQGGMLHFHIQIPVSWVTAEDRKRLKDGIS